MQFGLFCSPKADAPGFAADTGQGFRDFSEFNIEAEALGFKSSFSVEHHFSGWNQSSATLMLLMALAMRTSTLRVGTAVLVLPWHNPVLLAEQAATLDLLSNGRFDFGIGKGYRHGEFKGFSMPQEEADARFDESVEVITRAFTSRERFPRAGRQAGLARACLHGQSGCDRRECSVRHAGRDRGHAGSLAGGRGRLGAADCRGWCRPIAPFRVRDHAGFCGLLFRPRGGVIKPNHDRPSQTPRCP